MNRSWVLAQSGCILAALLLGILFLVLPAHADGSKRADALTAAYIYYFTKFVLWDGNSLNRVCVVGAEPNLLREFNKVIVKSGGALILKKYDVSDDLAQVTEQGCHILYMAENRGVDIQSVFERVPLLVVSESVNAEFSVIQLVMDGKRLSFEINRTNAQIKNLSESAKLMKLAKRIKE